MLFGEAVPVGDWTSIVSAAVQLGGFATIVVYLVTKGIPDMQKAHADSAKEMQNANNARLKETQESYEKGLVSQATQFAASLTAQRQDIMAADGERRQYYKELMQQQQQANDRQLQAVIAHCDGEISKYADTFKVELVQLNKSNEAVGNTLEELKEVIKELAREKR